MNRIGQPAFANAFPGRMLIFFGKQFPHPASLKRQYQDDQADVVLT